MLQYCYTGDRKALIPNGYSFHKLYARNYHAYNKGEIWLFPITKMMVEINCLFTGDHQVVIKFILDNKHQPREWWERPSRVFPKQNVPLWFFIEGVVVNGDQAKSSLGEQYFFVDKMPLSWEFVQSIIELDNLGSLTLKEI